MVARVRAAIETKRLPLTFNVYSCAQTTHNDSFVVSLDEVTLEDYEAEQLNSARNNAKYYDHCVI